MRISDWSSDVCSSDLADALHHKESACSIDRSVMAIFGVPTPRPGRPTSLIHCAGQPAGTANAPLFDCGITAEGLTAIVVRRAFEPWHVRVQARPLPAAPASPFASKERSEERRGGTEGVRPGRVR